MSDKLGVQISELLSRYEALQRAVDESECGQAIRWRAKEIRQMMDAQVQQLAKSIESILGER